MLRNGSAPTAPGSQEEAVGSRPIGDDSLLNHLDCRRELVALDGRVQLLGALWCPKDFSESRGEEHDGSLVAVAGRVHEDAKRLEVFGDEADLFEQFSVRRRLKSFTRDVTGAGRHLEDSPSHCRPKLSDEDDMTILVDGHYCDRSRMPHDLPVELRSIGRREVEPIDIDHKSIEQPL